MQDMTRSQITDASQLLAAFEEGAEACDPRLDRAVLLSAALAALGRIDFGAELRRESFLNRWPDRGPLTLEAKLLWLALDRAVTRRGGRTDLITALGLGIQTLVRLDKALEEYARQCSLDLTTSDTRLAGVSGG